MTICPSCGYQTTSQASATFSVDDTILACCNRAYDEAENHGAQEVQLVHFLYAIVQSASARSTIVHFGFSPEKLGRDLASAFPRSPQGHRTGPRVSIGLNTLMRHAGREAGQNARDRVKVEDILTTLLHASNDLPGIGFIRQCLEQSRTQQSPIKHQTTFYATAHRTTGVTATTQACSSSCQQTMTRVTERLNAQESLLKAITEQLIHATARSNTDNHAQHHHSERAHATRTSRANTAGSSRSGNRQSREAATSKASSANSNRTRSEHDAKREYSHDADRQSCSEQRGSGQGGSTSNSSRAHQSRYSRSDSSGLGNGHGHGDGTGHASASGNGHGYGNGGGQGHGNGRGHAGGSGERASNRTRAISSSWIKRARMKIKNRNNNSNDSSNDSSNHRTNTYGGTHRHRNGYDAGQGSSNRHGARTASSERSAWADRDFSSRDRVRSQNDNEYDSDHRGERNNTHRNDSNRRPRQTRAREPGTREKRFYLSLDDDIVDAPSIGQKTAARLIPEGIQTIRDLLDCDPDDLAARLDYRHIPSHRIEAWQKQARLVCTIPWLRGTHAQFLVGAGFDAIPKILKADRDEICAAILRFATTRDGQSILRSGPPPQVERILAWVDHTALAEPERAA